jgi:aarF domain-containing kinase
MLDMSEAHTCSNPLAFVEAMRTKFESLDPSYISTHTADVLREMIDTLRDHSVTLKGTISTVVVTTLVLEGWSHKLNPDLRILDTLRDLLSVSWQDRMCRTVDRIMSGGGELAVA